MELAAFVGSLIGCGVASAELFIEGAFEDTGSGVRSFPLEPKHVCATVLEATSLLDCSNNKPPNVEMRI